MKSGLKCLNWDSHLLFASLNFSYSTFSSIKQNFIKDKLILQEEDLELLHNDTILLLK
jgi:hypothetical protein